MAEKKAIDDDPWNVVDPPYTGKSWKEKTFFEKLKTVFLFLAKIVCLIGLLYMFICSLDFLSNAFKLLGGKAAGEAFQSNAILTNPIADLMIGVLATVLLQSSSTTTSIVVTMVAADILTVRPAIFLVMGANIGTSVTNTIVSMGHAGERNEFRRAFGGATVHDMFNWLSVIILLPIEWLSGSFGSWKGCGLLCQMTGRMVKGLSPEESANTKKDLLKVVTKPFTSLIIQLDKDVLKQYATLNSTELAKLNASLIKHTCSSEISKPQAFSNNITGQCEIRWVTETEKKTCEFMFAGVVDKWSDAAIGVCLLLIALAILIVCLVLIVKLLHSLLRGKIAALLKRFVNADFPGCAKYFTGYLAILLGAGLTMLVQSSSIFTSAITPLVGVGVLKLERMYPLTLGANIGTTFTAILAALASDVNKLDNTLQVALCHLFFNIFGIIIWYPVPFMRKVPISFARTLGNTTAKYRWFAMVYLVLMFFVFPGFIFGLSIAGDYVIMGVGLPLLAFFIIIGIINSIQSKKPEALPQKLRNWNFLPKPLHSLEPYDKLFVVWKKTCCPCCKDEKPTEPPVETLEHHTPPPSYMVDMKESDDNKLQVTNGLTEGGSRESAAFQVHDNRAYAAENIVHEQM